MVRRISLILSIVFNLFLLPAPQLRGDVIAAHNHLGDAILRAFHRNEPTPMPMCHNDSHPCPGPVRCNAAWPGRVALGKCE